jgi:hypothetical protein
MTKDEIMHMAREAGFYGGEISEAEESFVHFAALVAAAEREAICPIVYGNCGSDNEAQRIVNAIRARKEK